MGGLERIRNLSLRKTLVLYIVFFLILGVMLSSLTINFAYEQQNSIWKKYISINEEEITNEQENVGEEESTEGIRVYYTYPRVSSSDLTDEEHAMVEFCDFLQTWSFFIYGTGCVLGAVFLFYNSKIKVPLGLLNQSAKNIEENNLDFTLQYYKKDEMGQLCNSVEKMREQLQHNYLKMWRMMEEQKRVNAAFAHDLRTPLTVLRGYSDLLIQYVPEGKIKEEKLISTLSMMSRQITRLEDYTVSMKQLASMEGLELEYVTTDTSILKQTITESASILAELAGKQIKVSTIRTLTDFIQVDTKVVFVVIENLLNNATRYAKTRVQIDIEQEEEFFVVTISDDGNGFQAEDLQNATKPYYKDKSEENAGHFGLGLYISSVLCQKHGGTLVLANGENGGAKVIAKFKT